MLINNMAGTSSSFYDIQMSSKLQKTGFVIRLLKEEVKIKHRITFFQGDDFQFYTSFTFPHLIFDVGSCMNAVSIMQMA